LYKQATTGDAPTTFTMMNGSWNIVAEHAKHRAWLKMKGMSSEVAAAHYVDAVEAIESGEDTDDSSQDGNSPMGNGFAHTVSLPAMENGGHDESMNGEDTLEEDLLRAAGENDHKKVEKLLVTGVVQVDHADESGQTALHLAADKGSVDCVKKLLQYGADPNAADQDGISVLQAAVIAGHVDVCLILLDHGADPNQRDADGDTPRSCAADDGSEEMKKLFNS
jgi:ankyrin repeat protein